MSRKLPYLTEVLLPGILLACFSTLPWFLNYNITSIQFSTQQNHSSTWRAGPNQIISAMGKPAEKVGTLPVRSSIDLATSILLPFSLHLACPTRPQDTLPLSLSPCSAIKTSQTQENNSPLA
ncbi:hypothetical protein B0H19DRAFT_1080124 [Mycena capillaripes]|nr:hypothetical protein B0H19DRAFT_1080124 [Mycena capillaripes]